MASSEQEQVAAILKLADIRINGSRPFDIQVHNAKFYKRVLGGRELALGESYMDGWWDAKNLDEFISRVYDAKLEDKVRISPALVKSVVTSMISNRQSIRKAARNAKHHYNIGNDLYERMLDKRMMYSCAYWEVANDLDEAQEAKMELICRKLKLKKGMTLLDIGCGWGGFAEYAARKYGATVTAISPAEEQVKLAKERCKGLKVKVLQKDYRELTGKFDRIVSIGMLEHVGHKNYRKFFEKCNQLLIDDGLMLHHTIGRHKMVLINPWIDKYIFPGAVIPALTQISEAVEDLLIVEDVHNFGPYYDKTLMAWHHNFVKHYPEIKDKYDERFFRMWTFYLLASAGSFRSRDQQLYQIVFSKIRPSAVYKSIR